MAYDKRCYELAEHFAGGMREEKIRQLAQVIQDSIEDWLDFQADQKIEED
jgi:hypothetical protein